MATIECIVRESSVLPSKEDRNFPLLSAVTDLNSQFAWSGVRTPSGPASCGRAYYVGNVRESVVEGVVHGARFD